MILLTVGTQLPFDRLVEAVDRFAPKLNEQVIAQVGRSKYACRNIQSRENFEPAEFKEYLKNCSKIISHAGIGTVLNAKKFGKPIILLPRLAKFGEHRNDHQLATCRQLGHYEGIYVANDEENILEIICRDDLVPMGENSASGSIHNLTKTIRDFIR